MPDRNDVASYPTTTDSGEYAATTANADSTDQQIRDTANGRYATPESLHDFVDPKSRSSIFTEQPGRFYTQYDITTKTVLQAITVYASGTVYVGKGFLAGLNIVDRTTANTGLVILHDGQDSSGIVLVALDGTHSTVLFNTPVEFKRGLYAEVVTPASNITAFIERTAKL